MRGSRAPKAALGVAAILTAALGVSTLAQSPSPVASVGPSASSGAGASPMTPASPMPPVAVGPIKWTRVDKGKDFTTNPAVYGDGQLPDGRIVVVGSVSDGAGQPVGAAWVSADGTKWSRLKGLKAPKGSTITEVANLGSTAVATGDAGDGTGLVWTSPDGTTWTPAPPLSGVIYAMTRTSTGLVGVGRDAGAPTAWTTTDGITWQSTALAPKGYAVQVIPAPDGSLVAAGTVGEDGQSETPVVWNSSDGVTWTQIPLAGLQPGVWSVPASAATPAGLVIAISEPGQTGRIGHVWSSPDGLVWTETYVDQTGSLTAAGSAGTDALLIGGGQELRSADGVTWTPSTAKTFSGWTVRNDIITLADGRLFTAGDAGYPQSVMATWTGAAAPLP